LEWERMDDKVSSRIKSELTGVSYFEQTDWDKMIQFMIDASSRMERAFRHPVKKTNSYIKGKK
jgi:hypothetical protein